MNTDETQICNPPAQPLIENCPFSQSLLTSAPTLVGSVAAPRERALTENDCDSPVQPKSQSD
jgi:hypothetical protein